MWQNLRWNKNRRDQNSVKSACSHSCASPKRAIRERLISLKLSFRPLRKPFCPRQPDTDLNKTFIQNICGGFPTESHRAAEGSQRAKRDGNEGKSRKCSGSWRHDAVPARGRSEKGSNIYLYKGRLVLFRFNLLEVHISRFSLNT